LFTGSFLIAGHRRSAAGAPGFVGGAPVKPTIDRPPWKIGILPLRSGIDPQFIGWRKSRRPPRLRERREPNEAVADTQEDGKRHRKSEGRGIQGVDENPVIRSFSSIRWRECG
jgi:hypothetical protein